MYFEDGENGDIGENEQELQLQFLCQAAARFPYLGLFQ
jgi:hypothetical protein